MNTLSKDITEVLVGLAHEIEDVTFDGKGNVNVSINKAEAELNKLILKFIKDLAEEYEKWDVGEFERFGRGGAGMVHSATKTWLNSKAELLELAEKELK